MHLDGRGAHGGQQPDLGGPDALPRRQHRVPRPDVRAHRPDVLPRLRRLLAGRQHQWWTLNDDDLPPPTAEHMAEHMSDISMHGHGRGSITAKWLCTLAFIAFSRHFQYST